MRFFYRRHLFRRFVVSRVFSRWIRSFSFLRSASSSSSSSLVSLFRSSIVRVDNSDGNRNDDADGAIAVNGDSNNGYDASICKYGGFFAWISDNAPCDTDSYKLGMQRALSLTSNSF